MCERFLGFFGFFVLYFCGRTSHVCLVELIEASVKAEFVGIRDPDISAFVLGIYLRDSTPTYRRQQGFFLRVGGPANNFCVLN